MNSTKSVAKEELEKNASISKMSIADIFYSQFDKTAEADHMQVLDNHVITEVEEGMGTVEEQNYVDKS